jgi:undecaprenyl diphosphate synthase
MYVFSAENWGRPRQEVAMLMDLLVEMTRREIRELNKNNVRLHAIGDLGKLPPKTRKEFLIGIEETSGNTGLNLVLAVSYGGRAEIIEGLKKFAHDALADPSIIEGLSEESFRKYLYTAQFPDPDLIIRTSGENRTSNFLLWQSAYAELYFTDVLWPDFDKKRLEEAIADFNKRERRFGKVKES